MLSMYLQGLLDNPVVQGSEPLFAFLNPSTRHTDEKKQPVTQPEKTPWLRFASMKQRLKGGFGGFVSFVTLQDPSASKAGQDPLPDVAHAGTEADVDGEDAREARDSLMQPLLLLVDEIFELRGITQFLRRQMVAFVQLSYGNTINQVGCPAAAVALAVQGRSVAMQPPDGDAMCHPS